MRSARVGTLLGAVALLAAGCAQEDDAHHLPPLADPGAAADEALAESALLTLDDFPTDWRTQRVPSVAGDLGPEAEAQLARCLGAEGAVFDTDLPHATTPLFVSPARETVSVRISLAPDDRGPRAAIERLRQPEAPDCFAEAVQDQILPVEAVEGVDYGTPSAVAIPYADFGDTTVAWRTSIPVTAEGETVRLYADMVVVRVDRALVTFSFNAQIRPYDRDGSERIVLMQVERVTDEIRADDPSSRAAAVTNTRYRQVRDEIGKGALP